jgi:hypothetical protein
LSKSRHDYIFIGKNMNFAYLFEYVYLWVCRLSFMEFFGVLKKKNFAGSKIKIPIIYKK